MWVNLNRAGALKDEARDKKGKLRKKLSLALFALSLKRKRKFFGRKNVQNKISLPLQECSCISEIAIWIVFLVVKKLSRASCKFICSETRAIEFVHVVWKLEQKLFLSENFVQNFVIESHFKFKLSLPGIARPQIYVLNIVPAECLAKECLPEIFTLHNLCKFSPTTNNASITTQLN